MINGVPMWYPSVLNTMGMDNINMETVPKLLAEHLATFTPYLGRSEQKKHFTTLIQGRLSDLDRKSNEPVAIAFSGVGSVRNVANFMSRDHWDEKGMLEAYRLHSKRKMSCCWRVSRRSLIQRISMANMWVLTVPLATTRRF